MQELYTEVNKLKSRVSKIFIYGTGMYGRNIFNILREMDVCVDGFVQTKPDKSELYGLHVYGIDELIGMDCGFILGLNNFNSKCVRDTLSDKGFNMDNVILGYRCIDNGDRLGYDDEIPTMEITTRIGCRVNCRYCPQSKLVKRYSNAGNPETEMRLEAYKRCLDKLPANCVIMFCGMAEPFLNPACIDMIKYTIETGRKVNLYTTLIGLDEVQLDELLTLPVSFTVLHVADKYGYAKIKTDDAYYSMVEKIINCKKSDGTPFVNMCNAQAEPDERVKQICKGKYEIMHELQDRAGNLNDDKLVTASRRRTGKISCSFCGQTLNHNILLPDGRVLLCCMDYGMQHVLGNLLEDSYEDIMNGDEIRKVRRAMAGDERLDVLCRSCSSATEI